MTETYDDRVCRSEYATRFIKQRGPDSSPTLDSDAGDSPSRFRKRFKPAVWTSILAGATAAVLVDITLYPLDTLKTRLQSIAGFRATGGFKGVYKGIIPVLLGSAPISGLFFATYNTILNTFLGEKLVYNTGVYVMAAGSAEIVSASLRVPLEIVKQRRQTSNMKNMSIIKKTMEREGIFGFYRGFWSTLMRELPFSSIQYPLWEYFVNLLMTYEKTRALDALQTAYCGALAGAIAATVTTPMDVVRTRIMLEEREKLDRYKRRITYNIGRDIYRERGLRGFFAGVIPRILWIMLGGFIYFGTYEKIKLICETRGEALTEVVKLPIISPSYLEEKIFTFKTVTSPENQCHLSDPDKQKECENQSKFTQNIIDTTLLEVSSNQEESPAPPPPPPPPPKIISEHDYDEADVESVD